MVIVSEYLQHMASDSIFIYAPLDVSKRQIRVLNLYPGVRHDNSRQRPALLSYLLVRDFLGTIRHITPRDFHHP